LRDLHGKIISSSNQADNSGSIGKAGFQKIVDTGLLRVLYPKDQGGAEYSAPDMLPLIGEIAKADGLFLHGRRRDASDISMVFKRRSIENF
tara:strand:+ start:315 stop:587 length:273 start_codon:yes stop_codon:yes gene_type:complete